jgi:hypothetical protein
VFVCTEHNSEVYFKSLLCDWCVCVCVHATGVCVLRILPYFTLRLLVSYTLAAHRVYTCSFGCRYTKKSAAVICGDRRGHTTGPPYSVYVPEHVPFKHCWTFSRSVLELRRATWLESHLQDVPVET